MYRLQCSNMPETGHRVQPQLESIRHANTQTRKQHHRVAVKHGKQVCTASSWHATPDTHCLLGLGHCSSSKAIGSILAHQNHPRVNTQRLHNHGRHPERCFHALAACQYGQETSTHDSRYNAGMEKGQTMQAPKWKPQTCRAM